VELARHLSCCSVFDRADWRVRPVPASRLAATVSARFAGVYGIAAALQQWRAGAPDRRIQDGGGAPAARRRTPPGRPIRRCYVDPTGAPAAGEFPTKTSSRADLRHF